MNNVTRISPSFIKLLEAKRNMEFAKEQLESAKCNDKLYAYQADILQVHYDTLKEAYEDLLKRQGIHVNS